APGIQHQGVVDDGSTGEIDVVPCGGEQAAAADIQTRDAVDVSAGALFFAEGVGGADDVDVIGGLDVQIVPRADAAAHVVHIVAGVELHIGAVQGAVYVVDVVGSKRGDAVPGEGAAVVQITAHVEANAVC